MKKLNILLSALLSVFLFTSVQAGSIGIGITGNAASVSADGTETEASSGSETDVSVKSATAGNDFMYGSTFIEYSFGDSERFTFGIDYVPGTADVNRKNISRTDTTVAATEANQQDGTYTANAEISGHTTYYGELKIGAGGYIKAGFAEVEIKTKDTSTTSGTTGNYPDVTLDAWVYGIGYKGELGTNTFYKIEGTVTDYDTFKATSSTSNTVSANLDSVKATLALGYKF